MKHFFSNKECGFYSEDTLEYCKSIGVLPDDLQEVSEEELENFTGVLPQGKRQFWDGKMIWVDAQLSQEERIEHAEFRRNGEMKTATTRINALVEAQDDGDITPEELNELAQLRTYRSTLRRLNIAESDVNWPIHPTGEQR
jgi:hypothetical protein